MKGAKVCVIGAGASGITTSKALYQAGIDFDCFEKGSKIGGNWLYNNDNGVSAAYQSLHINTSKQLMAYSDFPMPDDYPDYPHHSLIYQYFEKYVDHFGFREKIQFNTSVIKVEKLGDRKYLVHTDRLEPKEYTDVIVANGHHWSPKWAEFEGEFTGEESHTHAYKTYHGFEGKKVLIIGIGNSAVDIACELTNVTPHVTISTRSGAYIIPKYLFGQPTDHISKPPISYAPLFIQRWALKTALFFSIGNQKNYGVPVPNRPILKEHPTISQELLNKVGHGKIKIKPNVQRLAQKEVYFEDGSSAEFDHIIYATGYDIKFPFLDASLFEVKNNEMPLYEYVVSPEHEGLYFIGFIQPLGAVMPLSELQAKWVTQLIQGKSHLPRKEQMYQWIKKNREKMIERYGSSSRHTIQVDFFPYKRKLRQLIK